MEMLMTTKLPPKNPTFMAFLKFIYEHFEPKTLMLKKSTIKTELAEFLWEGLANVCCRYYLSPNPLLTPSSSAT